MARSGVSGVEVNEPSTACVANCGGFCLLFCGLAAVRCDLGRRYPPSLRAGCSAIEEISPRSFSLNRNLPTGSLQWAIDGAEGERLPRIVPG